MTTLTQFQKAEDGSSAIDRRTVNQTTGVVRQRAFSDWYNGLPKTNPDAGIIDRERFRITDNSFGINSDGEMVYIYGEIGHRRITVGNSAATTHGRTVVLDSATQITLDGDTNTCLPTSGAPSIAIASGNVGNVMVDTTAKIVYKAVTIGGAWTIFRTYANSALPNPVPFNTVLDLSGNSAVSTVYNQTGPLNLSVNLATAALGAGISFSIIANGNAITVTGSNAANLAAGNVVTANGVLNEFSFIKTAAGVIHTVCQPGYVPSTTVGPALSSVEVLDLQGGLVTRWTFAGALDSTVVPPASAFTIAGHAVASVAAPVSSYVDVTHSVGFAYANIEVARTATYTQPGSNSLRSIGGLLCPTNATAVSVLNNFGVNWSNLTNIRLDQVLSLTESGDGSSGNPYKYTSTAVGASTSAAPRAGSSVTIPANADCQFIWNPGVTTPGGSTVTDAMVFLGDAVNALSALIGAAGYSIYGIDINNNGTNITSGNGTAVNGTPNGGLTPATTGSPTWQARLTRRLGKVTADLDFGAGAGWQPYHKFTDAQNLYGKDKVLALRIWEYVGPVGSTIPSPIKGFIGPAQTLS